MWDEWQEEGGNEWFYYELYEYIAMNVNLKTYVNMTPEKKYKLVERMTILACKKYAPTKNYGIPKDEIRSFILGVILNEIDKIQ